MLRYGLKSTRILQALKEVGKHIQRQQWQTRPEVAFRNAQAVSFIQTRHYPSTAKEPSGDSISEQAPKDPVPTLVKKNSVSYDSKKTFVEVMVGGDSRQINCLWLRDNCRCSECFNEETLQKNVLVHQLPPEPRPKKIKMETKNMEVRWTDGHVSNYNLKWLFDNSFPGRSKKVERVLWDAGTLANVTHVPYAEFMQDDHTLKEFVSNLLKFGVSFVRGCPDTIEETARVAERLCFIQKTLFGAMWHFTADGARADTAYSTVALGAHNDNTYFSTPSGIQVFHCLEHDGEGGDTLLLDGFFAAEKLRKTDLDAFRFLADTEIYHEYKEETPSHLNHIKSLSRVIRTHPVTDEVIWVRYNQYDRAPIKNLKHDDVALYYDALTKFAKIVEDPDNTYWLKLQSGDVLFIDNWRVMHGRAAFTGKRKVCGCYLPRDDWIGKARTLGIIT